MMNTTTLDLPANHLQRMCKADIVAPSNTAIGGVLLRQPSFDGHSFQEIELEASQLEAIIEVYQRAKAALNG